MHWHKLQQHMALVFACWLAVKPLWTFEGMVKEGEIRNWPCEWLVKWIYALAHTNYAWMFLTWLFWLLEPMARMGQQKQLKYLLSVSLCFSCKHLKMCTDLFSIVWKILVWLGWGLNRRPPRFGGGHSNNYTTKLFPNHHLFSKLNVAVLDTPLLGVPLKVYVPSCLITSPSLQIGDYGGTMQRSNFKVSVNNIPF